MNSGFKKHLEERILQLEKSYNSYKADEQKLTDSITPETGELEKRHTEMLIMGNSARASYVFEMLEEYRSLLKLFDLEYPDNKVADTDRIESVANFISSCIESCETEKQIYTANNLISNMQLMFKDSRHQTQLSAWVDSLNLKIHNLKIRLNFH